MPDPCDQLRGQNPHSASGAPLSGIETDAAPSHAGGFAGGTLPARGYSPRHGVEPTPLTDECIEGASFQDLLFHAWTILLPNTEAVREAKPVPPRLCRAVATDAQLRSGNLFDRSDYRRPDRSGLL